MAKYFSSQVAERAAGSAIEWMGGVGFTRETGVEKYWRSVPFLTFDAITRDLTGPSHRDARTQGRQDWSDLRGHEQHPAEHDRQVHPEEVGRKVGRGDATGR